MTDLSIAQRPAPASASSPRSATVQLFVLHNDPRPAADALAAFSDPAATAAPHYHIAADGTVTQLVDETLAARHSGPADLNGQSTDIDQVSVGVTIERTPGSPYPAALLRSLRALWEQVAGRYGLNEEAIRRWDPAEQGVEIGPGFVLPVNLPVVPPETPANALLDLGGSGMDDGDSTCAPPPLPPLSDGAVLDGEDVKDVPNPADLWVFLQQETYRQKGEGFQIGWALHLKAALEKLGAPLAPSAGVSVGGKEYLMQPFSRGVLFNEKPLWSNLSLLDTSGGVPTDELGLALLSAAFTSANNPLKSGWAFHQIAAKERLGVPLTAAYRITVAGSEYSLQVFAGDTLYCQVPNWGDVRRLSATSGGDLRSALLAESYKPSGSEYDPFTPFQQLADSIGNLGNPLTGPYQAYLNSAVFTVQVFANDTLYSGFDAPPTRLSELAPPANLSVPQPQQPAPAPVAITTSAGRREDATITERPTFTMLPVPGQPPISQFYGYTRFAASATGRSLYGMTQCRHSGLDFAVEIGTPLIAIGQGLVVHSGENGPFGAKLPQSIVVRYGAIYALYGHASVCSVVKGQYVVPGQEIGRSGSFNGPHLHFELRAVPQQALGNTSASQNAINPGRTFNPVDCFSSTLDDYFARMLGRLRSTDGSFCCGSFRDQGEIVFGGPQDTRPCES